MLLLYYLTLLAFAARPLVLYPHAHPFDNDEPARGEDAQNLARLALVDAGAHHDRITFLYVESVHGSYTTSGAREMMV